MQFSIIIPAHNSQDTIETCVKSIIDHSEVEPQIIIVENGSTDNTLDICKGLQDKYDNLEVYQSDIPNVSNARNIGLQYATGDVVSFCDADDYLMPYSLDKVSEIFENETLRIVCTGFQIKNDKLMLQRANKNEEIISSSKMIEYILCNPNTMGSVWNKFFRKELIDNVEFRTDLTYMEDTFFCAEVLSENKDEKIYIYPEITYCYVNNSESVTNDSSKLFDGKSNLKYLNSLNKMLDELSLTEREKKYVKDDIFRIAVGIMWDNNVYKTSLQSCILYKEIKRSWSVFARRVFRFDWKNRIKLMIKGTFILLKSNVKNLDGD